MTEQKVFTKEELKEMRYISYADYQRQASSTAMYASKDYPFMLLMEEFQEFLGTSNVQDEIAELGDLQWCISQCYKELGLTNHTPDAGKYHDTPILVFKSVLAKGMRKHQMSLVELLENAVEVGVYDDLVLALNSLNEYCIFHATRINSHITSVRLANVIKLADRKSRNVIVGAGDHR